MLRIWLAGALLLAVGAPAAAQETPAVDWFVGYQHFQARPGEGVGNYRLNGFNTSVTVHLNPWLGLVSEVSGSYGEPEITFPGPITDTRNTKIHTFMFGPRLTLRRGDRFEPFGHFLFGGARQDGGPLGPTGVNSNIALAAGGGFDIRATDRVAIRVAQADYVLTRFRGQSFSPATQHNFRYSAGLVVRFGRR
jgi:opacity protein-like surface antigen